MHTRDVTQMLHAAESILDNYLRAACARARLRSAFNWGVIASSYDAELIVSGFWARVELKSDAAQRFRVCLAFAAAYIYFVEDR